MKPVSVKCEEPDYACGYRTQLHNQVRDREMLTDETLDWNMRVIVLLGAILVYIWYRLVY